MEKSGPRLRVSRKRQAVLLKLLRTIRQERELTQAEVAARWGCPQSVISKYESGERRLDLLELYDLCSVIGIPITELVERFEHDLERKFPKRRPKSKQRPSSSAR